MKARQIFVVPIFWAIAVSLACAVEYPSTTQPGQAKVRMELDKIILENNVLRLVIGQNEGKLKPARFCNIQTGDILDESSGEFFHVTVGREKKKYACSQFIQEPKCRIVRIKPEPQSRTAAKRYAGIQVQAELTAPDKTFAVEWSVELRDGSNYIRQFLTILPGNDSIQIASIQFNDLAVSSARVAGTVAGSPVIADDFFIAYEHPNAANGLGPEDKPKESKLRRIICRLDRNTVLQPGQSLVQSAVMGVVPKNQLRRGFLHYIERERIVPYRPFLHYNSWYDIAWGGREKMNSDECVEVIDGFGIQLTTKRNVQLDSFVFDDGWDDPKTLWKILKGNFPDGFSPLQEHAQKYGSNIGLWLSPWGGYGKAKADRLAYGKTQGFETSEAGFSLVGEKYFARFRESCVGFVEQYNVNFFKFDGVAANLLDETEALLRLCGELYSISDDMYISLTTGTWASPFWLLHADSVWRGGGDMGFHGKGAKREQWLTYRDKLTYQNMVKAGPLYPLNSFMNQGIAYAIWGTANLESNADEFAHEVHSFFGIGTGLQELYISHGRMTEEMWDILAEGAKWSRKNSDVLIDTHWVGGNPDKLEVYGCASWQDNRAIVMLRNPDDKSQTITLDIGQALELPPFADTKYTFKSPWQKDKKKQSLILKAGVPHTFELAPFEVLVLESAQSK